MILSWSIYFKWRDFLNNNCCFAQYPSSISFIKHVQCILHFKKKPSNEPHKIMLTMFKQGMILSPATARLNIQCARMWCVVDITNIHVEILVRSLNSGATGWQERGTISWYGSWWFTWILTGACAGRSGGGTC